jgi:hypothetical protein
MPKRGPYLEILAPLFFVPATRIKSVFLLAENSLYLRGSLGYYLNNSSTGNGWSLLVLL